MTVLVRYWAAAREAAGTTEERLDAGTLEQLLAAIRVRHADRPRLAEVLTVCSVLVDGVPTAGRDPAVVVLDDGAEVDLLPPFAGG